MRRTACEQHILDHIRAIDDANRNDVHEALLAEQDADPEGAFGALCHWIDADGTATREQVTTTLTAVFNAITDRTADRIVDTGQGWHILAALVRDENY